MYRGQRTAKVLAGAPYRLNGFYSTSGVPDACETTTTPQLRNLSVALFATLALGGHLQARAQIATISILPSQSSPAPNGGPSRPTAGRGKTSPRPSSASTPTARSTQPPGSLAAGRPAEPLRSDRRQQRLDLQRRVRRSPQVARLVLHGLPHLPPVRGKPAPQDRGRSLHEHPFRRPQRRSRLPGDRVRRRTDAATFRTASRQRPRPCPPTRRFQPRAGP